MSASSSLRHPLRGGALIALGTFLVYLLGACRTIYVGDSGELVAAVATLGIPHPSGYPLYVLLGKLWTLLVPIGSIAFRMSLFSAFTAAAGCGLLYALLRRLGISALVGLFAALLLAFSPSFWSQANVQRVYSLNALFVIAVTAALFEWRRGPAEPHRPIGWLVLAAFLTGLGACNHTFMGLFGIAAGLFAVIREPTLLKRPKHFFACVGAGLAGLFPYAYLPIRSRMDPHLDWGNPETLDGFLGVVLRRDFWHRAWMESSADWLPILADYASGLAWELAWAGTALAVAGAILGRKGWPVLFPVLVMAANLWALGVHGSRSDIFIWHRYYIPSYIMAAVLAAFGLELAVRRWGKKVAVAALAIPAVLLVTGYAENDRSRYRIADDFSRQLLATLPPGAHLSASDDNILFVLMYLHLAEGLRPDVDLIMQGVGDADLGQLRFDPDDDPLYFTHHPNWRIPELEVVPVGLVFRTVRAGSNPELTLPAAPLAGADDPRVPKDYLTQNLVGQYHYMHGITFEKRHWPTAQEAFARATAAAPSNDVLFYNLGLIYRRNGLARRSLEAFERAHEINPRHIPSGRPVRAGDRLAELRQEVERLEALETALLAETGAADLHPGTPERHQRLAELLAARGEELTARGHVLLAEELRSSLALEIGRGSLTP